MKKIDELRWVRAFSPDVIPKYLIEQIKKRDFEVDDFLRYHKVACMRETQDGFTLNPLSQLWVLANPDNLVKGVLWFVVDPLCKAIVIQTYSVDPEYWKDGGAMEKCVSHVKDIYRKTGMKKIYWITDYPKHNKRHGFHPSKSILMEYREEAPEDLKDPEEIEDGQNTYGGREPQRERTTPDTPATTEL
ncbi:MAG TPA: hypothetical protein PL000_07310 [Anaerolineales bacterium]|nr:hypothetical protein [Anaerolineales bacterium]